MACYTLVRVEVDDPALAKKARENLGLSSEEIPSYMVGRFNVEYGQLKARAALRRLAPTAVVRKDGNALVVQVNL